MTKKPKKLYRDEIITHCLEAAQRLLTIGPSDLTRKRALEYLDIAKNMHTNKHAQVVESNDSKLAALARLHREASSQTNSGKERAQLRQQS